MASVQPDLCGCQESMTGAGGGGDLFMQPEGFHVYSHPFISDHVQTFGAPSHMGLIGKLLVWLVWIFAGALRVPVLGRVLSWLPYWLEIVRELSGIAWLFEAYKPLWVPFFCNTILVSPKLQPSNQPVQYDSCLIDPPGLHMLGCHGVLVTLQSGQTAWMINMHLNHDVSQDGARRRCDELKRVLHWRSRKSAGEDHGLIIVGDCNTLWKGGEPLKKLMQEHGLRSAHAVVHGQEPAYTWPSGIVAPFMDLDGAQDWPKGVCLDFIWVCDRIKVAAAGIAGNEPHEDDPTLYPSDHIAVWADLL